MAEETTSTPVLARPLSRSAKRTLATRKGPRFAEAARRALTSTWDEGWRKRLEEDAAAGKLTMYDAVAWGMLRAAAGLDGQPGDNRAAKWLTERVGEATITEAEGLTVHIGAYRTTPVATYPAPLALAEKVGE